MDKLTVKELQAKLIEMGMPEDDVMAFRTKKPLIATINTLAAKEVEKEVQIEEKVEEVIEKEKEKKVKSITEPVNPVEDREVNTRWTTKAMIMKKKLEAQPKISILVNLEEGEKMGVVEERVDASGETYQIHISGAIIAPQLNGFKWMIPKGIYTPVPQQIAEIVAKSQQQTLAAGDHISLTRTDPRTGKKMDEVI